MKDIEIKTAQDYLTVLHDDRVHQIINVDLLLKRHSPESVVDFMEQLQEQHHKELRKLLKKDKTDPRINDLVAKRFRIRMAINTIRNSERRDKAA